jgi:thiamine-phosphate pyrophosphorylase
LIPRFYPILDTETIARHGLHRVDCAAQILDAGATILQIRHKGFFDRTLFDDIERVANLCARSNAIFVVNDRADVAKMFDAAIHLGQEDLTPSQARLVVGDSAIVGYSTHNEIQMRAAGSEPASYLAFGPIFTTSSKQNPDPTVGIEQLRRLRPLTDRKLVAIGGITRSNAREVIAAGADSVAVIGDLYPDVAMRTKEFLRTL